MFWNKKSGADLHGVPLAELQENFAGATNLKTTLKGNTLIVHQDRCTTRIEVVAPDSGEYELAP